MTDWTRFWRPTVSNDDDEQNHLITCVLCHDCDRYIFTDLDEAGIAAVRDAKIVTTIEVSEGGEVRVATSDAESEGEANIVTFTPATETNITNPLNGETVAVSGRGWRLRHKETQFTEWFSNVNNVNASSRARCWAPPR